MKVIFGLGKAKIQKFYKPVVTLGVFDGLHRGHVKLLKETQRCSRRIKGTSIVVTFYPHPQNELSIYSLRHRIRLLKEFGIDICVVLKFTKYFSRISADGFIKNLLIKVFHPRYIIVGENFRFGRYAKGTPQILREFAKIYGFKLKVIPVVKFRDRNISSTYIRSLITKGRISEASRVLSRPVTILGTVVKGNRLGRLLGFPTANIRPHHEVLPPSGVYIAKVRLNKKILKGLCYIGAKPTFSKSKVRDSSVLHIEMHIFDFAKSLYGKELEIQFLKRIRADKEFDSVISLTGQIKKDISFAKAFFSHLKPSPFKPQHIWFLPHL